MLDNSGDKGLPCQQKQLLSAIHKIWFSCNEKLKLMASTKSCKKKRLIKEEIQKMKAFRKKITETQAMQARHIATVLPRIY